MLSIVLSFMLQGPLPTQAPRLQFAPPPKARKVEGAIQQMQLSPVFREPYSCTEHPEGQLEFAGDAYGTDCLVTGGLDGKEGFMRHFRTDGRTNEDWYGWGVDVLAPADGFVEAVYINRVNNTPGKLGRPPASMIRFQATDGTMIVYAHVRDVVVKPGDRVKSGQPVAKVGNNGMGRSPHIHIGAYRDDLPLQIRWDLRAMGKLQRR